MERTTVDEGAMIWKLYNMGIVARTASVTVCFDLVRAHSSRVEEFPVSDEVMGSVIDQCDALFVSHRHGDHADQCVAQTFIDRGKPGTAPPDGCNYGQSDDVVPHMP